MVIMQHFFQPFSLGSIWFQKKMCINHTFNNLLSIYDGPGAVLGTEMYMQTKQGLWSFYSPFLAYYTGWEVFAYRLCSLFLLPSPHTL